MLVVACLDKKEEARQLWKEASELKQNFRDSIQAVQTQISSFHRLVIWLLDIDNPM